MTEEVSMPEVRTRAQMLALVQLDVLCQRLFGKKSERVDARQLQLALEFSHL